LLINSKLKLTGVNFHLGALLIVKTLLKPIRDLYLEIEI